MSSAAIATGSTPSRRNVGGARGLTRADITADWSGHLPVTQNCRKIHISHFSNCADAVHSNWDWDSLPYASVSESSYNKLAILTGPIEWTGIGKSQINTFLKLILMYFNNVSRVKKERQHAALDFCYADFNSKNLSVCHKHKQHSETSRNFPFYLQPKGQRYSVNLSK